MIYLLALIGLVTLAVLLWKGFGPQRPAATNSSVVGPDDDPEFLWRMGRDARRSRGSDGTDKPE
ncbi:hypothetical protein [Antrihabitans cavernicola]|uniref:Uncharacterized protein n=1 Tax=Antrihabitans cavernicola TaxID=2495913 RepID=A0A5A7S713_9NOCA|nr:hypothetical protein [Spelaeibacter cavernicola]KAA0020153.1 hypothetical protein FOY51_21380 [Spelaeibacter cavernicola]